MPDWTRSMQQTFEYYIVDPGTWCDSIRVNNVLSCTISWDGSSGTMGSATIDVSEEFYECYIRIYLVTIQDGITEKIPMGTFLAQTPSIGFDGKSRTISLDAYSPLMELKEKMPPVGYTVQKGKNIMDMAYELCSANMRAPVIEAKGSAQLFNNFVANLDDSWLSFLTDLIANDGFIFSLDELGRVMFSPIQDTASLQPVWTYNDGNSSILYPEIDVERDLYGIPNVVEVLYTYNSGYYYATVRNNDSDSPTSVSSRGREIVKRIANPEILGSPTQKQLDAYAEQVLRELSALEYTLTYTHGYYPVRVGDCVRLNYTKAGLNNIKAKVISQSIKCEPGCKVTETATFTKNLWR